MGDDINTQPFAAFEACREAINAFNARWEGRIPGVDPGYDWAHVVLDNYNFDTDFIVNAVTRWFPEWLVEQFDQIKLRCGSHHDQLLQEAFLLNSYVTEELALIQRIWLSNTEAWCADDARGANGGGAWVTM